MIKDISLRVSPETASSREQLAPKVFGAAACKVNDWKVVRRSIDARKRDIIINLTVRVASGEDREVPSGYVPVEFHDVSSSKETVIIVGAGPAGLFGALECIRLGMRPIVLERGKDVESRRLDIAALNRERQIDPDSNYCFGEGGAGTFSDGKLYTRSKKRGNPAEVLSLLVQHGAKEEILIDSRPHIGSDRLPGIMKSIRQTILDCGGEVRFQTKVDRLIIRDGEAKGVVTADGEEIKGDAVILATGHSARDVYRSLAKDGVKMEAKGLAVGVRLEHLQHTIDKIQYHDPAGRGCWLPAAEYNFVTQADGRGVYSFCMCPGGVVVAAGSGPEELVVNGMSASSRSSIWANSGMVVEIHPGDFPEYAGRGEFEMLDLVEDLEKKFYKASSDQIVAPAQRMKDFVEGKNSKNLPPSSYIPGLYEARLDQLLPPFIATRLQKGFCDFGRKAKGFLTNDAILIGLESRTSSPVRIPRDKETLCHIEVKGLYPAGEGAGYAGGIVSAAIDGMRCARSIRHYLDYQISPQPDNSTTQQLNNPTTPQ
ncbi:MAG: NAD(P)/FAD-dependent oxidoreductase [Muribaculaceae bacterium]|nr:NAD(P)/FAD-dependent oxidoreductase [Muribaculaceae bacterium]